MGNLNILVTGATIGGIGYETALKLASLGHKLIITCRSLERAHAAADAICAQTACSRPDAFTLDLSEEDSISGFTKNLSEKQVSLDILINNAGFLKTDRYVNSKNIEMSMAVNYFGTRELTAQLLPLLNRGGRIINVSSSTSAMGKLDFNDLYLDREWRGFQAYFNSKYVLNMYTRQLADDLLERGITVNALHPGNIVTNIWEGLWPDFKLLKVLIRLIIKTGILSARRGARTSLYLALSPDVKDSTDGYYKNSRLARWPDNCLDKEKNRITLREFHQYHTV